MSIQFTFASGWVLDHQCSIDAAYGDTQCVSHSLSDRIYCKPSEQLYINEMSSGAEEIRITQFRCKGELFAIFEPFMMDSQFMKLKNTASCNETPTKGHEREREDGNLTVEENGLCSSSLIVPKTRKRKRKFNDVEFSLMESHKEIRPLLVTALKQMVDGSEYFNISSIPLKDNNLSARQASRLCGSEKNLREYVQRDTPLLVVLKNDKVSENYFNRLIYHARDTATTCNILGSTYLLPAHCSFLMSDISRVCLLRDANVTYDCIVVDPPWRNKSVKRKKTYDTLNEWDLLELPIRELSNSNALIVVWTTNKIKQQNFVTEQLFPAWKVSLLARWFWLKVTRAGVPVYDLNRDDLFKRPYETLLIGRRTSTSTNSSSEDEMENAADNEIPTSRVIVSVPCSIHSRKPPLNDVLKGFLPDDARCLELFARNLTPGWTSWGNEVLTFQNQDYFEEIHS